MQPKPAPSSATIGGVCESKNQDEACSVDGNRQLMSSPQFCCFLRTTEGKELTGENA